MPSTKNFTLNLVSQGSTKQKYLSENVNNSVFGVRNKNICISSESTKKATTYDLLFLIAICSPKNDNKHASELIN